METKKKEVNFSNMPLLSSLGHLAYGDVAFTAWRKLKKEKNAKEEQKK